MDQALLPSERGDVVLVKKLILNNSFNRPDSIYDTPRLLETARSFIMRKLSGESFSDLKYDFFGGQHRDRLRSSKEKFVEERTKDPLAYLNNFGQGFSEFSEESINNLNSWIESEDILMGDSSDEDDDSPESPTAKKSASLLGNWDISEDNLREIKGMFNMYDDVNEEVLEIMRDDFRHDYRQYEAFLSSFCDILEDMRNSKDVFVALKEKNRQSGLEVSGPGGVITYLTMDGFEFTTSDLRSRREMRELDNRTVSGYMSTSQAVEGSRPQREVLELEIQQITDLLPQLKDPTLTSIKKRLEKLKRDLDWLNDVERFRRTSSQLVGFDKNSFLQHLVRLLIRDNMWAPPALNPDISFMSEMLLTYTHDQLPKISSSGMIGQSELIDLQKSLWSPILNPSSLQAICYYLSMNLIVDYQGQNIFEFRRAIFLKEYLFHADD